MAEDLVTDDLRDGRRGGQGRAASPTPPTVPAGRPLPAGAGGVWSQSCRPFQQQDRSPASSPEHTGRARVTEYTSRESRKC